MSSIIFDKVKVELPIYTAGSRSLKKQLFQATLGGKINTIGNGIVVVSALNDITLTIKNGERVGLVGHNGAGKSTLLRLLSGVYTPSGGQIEVNGKVGSLIDVSFGIDQEASGLENIYLRGALLGLSRSTIKSKLDEIIEFSGLGDFIDMPVRTYSSGMHMRLAFSVSTIIRPEILLMDEWLSVGDEGFQARAEERIKALVDSTHILVIASHSRELIRKTCNRAIWLEHGQIKMDGTSESVTDAYFSQ